MPVTLNCTIRVYLHWKTILCLYSVARWLLNYRYTRDLSNLKYLGKLVRMLILENYIVDHWWNIENT